MLRTALLSLCLCLALPAAASSPFPQAIRAHLSLAKAPPTSCALCHNKGITGVGTVTTAFGKSLRAQGAVADDQAKLFAALDALGTTDSDADGTDDLTELRAGRDPNTLDAVDGGTGGGGGGDSEGPISLKYGCGASVVPALSSLALLAALGARRRRQR